MRTNRRPGFSLTVAQPDAFEKGSNFPCNAGSHRCACIVPKGEGEERHNAGAKGVCALGLYCNDDGICANKVDPSYRDQPNDELSEWSVARERAARQGTVDPAPSSSSAAVPRAPPLALVATASVLVARL